MNTKRQRGRGTTLRHYLQGEMKDPEFRRLYEEAAIELRVALEITKAREAKNMTQEELAEALKTKQQTVSRFGHRAQSGRQSAVWKSWRKLSRPNSRLSPGLSAVPKT